MSTTIIRDPMVKSASETPPTSSSTTAAAGKSNPQTEVEFAKCYCCGLKEECTPAYIERIRERFYGKWICGLCSEAVKYEIVRTERLIGTEEAMNRHMNFCKKFKVSVPPVDPTVDLIAAMRQILRRSSSSPRGLISTPSSPTKNDQEIPRNGLSRSESCFPALT